MPTHPDFQPIIQEIREKYNLTEINSDSEPVKELFLGDKEISFEEFLQDLSGIVQSNTNFLPPEYAHYYKIGKPGLGKPLDMQGRELPDDVMNFVNAMYAMLQSQMSVLIPILDNHYQAITQMLYVYLLTGETEEIPEDWVSMMSVQNIIGNKVIHLVATQLTDPNVAAQQFRELHKKTFGKHLPKVTKTVVSTAYYYQLKRLGKPWNFIVEEYILQNNFSMPKDRQSKKYLDVWRKHSERLKKRIQQCDAVLNVLIEEKK